MAVGDRPESVSAEGGVMSAENEDDDDEADDNGDDADAVDDEVNEEAGDWLSNKRASGEGRALTNMALPLDFESGTVLRAPVKNGRCRYSGFNVNEVDEDAVDIG